MKKTFLFLSIACFISCQLSAQNTSYNADAVPLNGVNNVGIGINALKITTGLRNVAVGIGALQNLGNASDNTAIGYNAMYNSLGTFFNTAVGKEALLNNQANYNTALGWGAMVSNVGGEANTATGGLALGFNGVGNFNTANGYLSLYSNKSGDGNTAMGVQSLYQNQFGNHNTAVGKEALYKNLGSYNTAHGYKALLSNSTGEGNTATGHSAMLLNSTGTWNTATGLSTLYNNTTGNSNTAFGLQSLVNNSTGNNNTATGREALVSNMSGSNNSALGYKADVSTDGLTNATAIGYQAKVTESNAIQLGDASVAKVFNGVGNNATFITGGLQVTGGTPGIGKVLTSDATGVATWQTNVAPTAGWLLTGNAGTVDGTDFIGTTDYVPFNIRVNNIASGRIEIDSLTANTFFGYSTGITSTGVNNTGTGWKSLNSNSTGNSNTANGFKSLFKNTSGNFNTADGYLALEKNTTGIVNTALGAGALNVNITGSRNTAVGVQSLGRNFANDNTAMGYQTLFYNTTGTRNAAFGRRTMMFNTTGSNNTAIGDSAGMAVSNLSNATAIGFEAIAPQSNSIQLGNNAVTKIFAGVGNTATIITGGLQVTGGSPGVGKVLTSNATGVATWQTPAAATPSWSLTGNAGTNPVTNFIGTTDASPLNIRVNNVRSGLIESNSFIANTFYGYQAGLSTTGFANTANGYQSLAANTTGVANNAFGYLALQSNNTGNQNVAVGNASLRFNTTGGQNTAMGYLSLNNNTIGTYNTAIGYMANVSNPNQVNSTAIGNGAFVNNSNKVRIGNGLVTVVEIQSTAIYTGSDARFKTNISESDVKGLDFIKRLRPVVYNMDTKKFEKFLTKNMPDSIRDIYMNQDFDPSTSIRQSGFIAQEVEKAAKQSGYNFNGIHKPENENDNYSLAYSQFVVPLVKAVQEQQAMIENLQNQIQQLQQKNLVETSPAVSVIELTDNNAIVLNQNVPNPFAQQTSITYNIPANAGTAQIMFYSVDGRLMKTAVISTKGKGVLNVYASDLSSGSYTYSLVVDGKLVDTKKLIKQ
jgi:trimeric autotransporter adhesin